MASYTPNYNLKKPAGTDVVDIADLNGNMDIIDTQLNSLNSKIVKTLSGTATSGNTGNVSLAMSIANVHVLSVVEKEDQLILIPFGSTGNWYFKTFDGSMNVAGNRAVKYEVAYIDK